GQLTTSSRPFRMYAFAATISGVGDGMLLVALPLLLASLDPSPFRIGLVEATLMLPWLVIAPFTGVLADRMSRRSLMIISDLFRAVMLVILALLVVADQHTFAVIAVIGFAVAAGETAFDAAAAGMLTSLVGKDVAGLEKANSVLSFANTGGNQLIGPLVGGLIFAVAMSAPFAFDAVTFALSSLLIWRIPRGTEPAATASSERSALSEIREAATWLFSKRALRALLILTMVANITVMAYWAPLVVVAQERMGVEPRFYGLFLSVLALGSLIGAALAKIVARRLGSRAGIAVGAAAFGLSVMIVGWSTNWVQGVVATAGIGVSVVVWSVLAISLRQSLIPDRMMGRTTSIFRAGTWGLMPVGAILGGVFAEFVGLWTPYVIFGGLMIITAGYVWLELGAAKVDDTRSEKATSEPAPGE
ncbi:MAG: MFS transporter, partial [Acidimicrobiia bacterium]|nr:MFS transporter [Acidimicrobiia bacterium]